jgi:hypothetical protein
MVAVGLWYRLPVVSFIFVRVIHAVIAVIIIAKMSVSQLAMSQAIGDARG